MNSDVAILIAAAAMSALLAVVVASRAKRSLTRWMFVLGMLSLSAESACNAWMGMGPSSNLGYWQTWKLAVSSLSPAAWLMFSLNYSRGNVVGSVRRWTPWLAAMTVGLLGLVWFSRGNLTTDAGQLPNTNHWTISLRWPGLVVYAVRLLASLGVLLNLERTFRASIGTMRWRIKYMVLGLAAVFVARIYTNSQVLLYNATNQHWWVIDAAALLLGCLLILRGLPRAGVFELEVYPSQTVLRHSLTITLAGLYLLIVGLGAKVVSYFGGETSFSLQAFIVLLSLVLLGLILQSDNVHLITRRIVSRHFERPFYDYRTVWRSFSEGTAACVDQTTLGRALVRLFAETFQALSVNLWLIDEKTETVSLAASTATSGTAAWNLIPTRREAIGIIQHFSDNKEPVDVDLAEGEWAETLRRCNPGEFPHGGHRFCLALRSGGELLALITLGDRVAGAPFSDQDFEMLKCAGNDAATGLLNARLLEKSLQSREFEAFQTMAAFFVHDLKNSASTLSLMLQNLPEHYDDPAFRDDALRGISKTVSHINNLVSRLNLLRQGFRITPVPAELDNIIKHVVADCGNKPGVTISTHFGSPPSIALDPDQIGKVITNLILNALEATDAGGKIDLMTRSEGAWAILTVTDTGCGMSNEFRDQSLFRPFQTTKKNGLGIGMFQSKMIVEAHRGTIAVQSEPGRGSTFEVRLPLTNNSLNPWFNPLPLR